MIVKNRDISNSYYWSFLMNLPGIPGDENLFASEATAEADPLPSYTVGQPQSRLHQMGRPSLKRKWSALMKSNQCPQTLGGMARCRPRRSKLTLPLENSEFVCKIRAELERRDQTTLNVEVPAHGSGTASTLSEEQKRKTKWAQDMIIAHPELCAEVCIAMTTGNNKT